MDSIIDILVLLPLVLIIHELGHAFFVKIFGGKITNVVLGTGKRVLEIGIFRLNLFYCAGAGVFYREIKKDTKFTRILIILGGVIFNGATILIISLMGDVFLSENYLLMRIYVISWVALIYNLVPMRLLTGMNSDGKQLIQIIRYGKSEAIPKNGRP